MDKNAQYPFGSASIGPALNLRQMLRGHKSVIHRLAWSPDGRIIASPSQDTTIRLWNLTSNEPSRILRGHTNAVYGVAWSPDGRMLASGSSDTTIRLWDIATGNTLFMMQGHRDSVRSISWCPAKKLLASGGGDHAVMIWSTETGELINTLALVPYKINSVSWSPNGLMLAFGSSGGYIEVWNMESSALLYRFSSQSSRVNSITWSHDGTILASGLADGTIRIWQVEEGKAVRILEGHKDSVTCISFSNDGKLLASKSKDNSVLLWRCDTWETVTEINETAARQWFHGLAFNPSSTTLATCGDRDRSVRIWDINIDHLLTTPKTLPTTHYVNAKVVVVGDTGTGKSGLSLVLSGEPFVPTESSHSRRIWEFGIYEKTLESGLKEIRELLIWDLAGQPGYRLIHQLHLNEAALVLVVFDARSETDPFSGVRYWDRVFRQSNHSLGHNGSFLRKLLVAARLDRGGIGVSRERITALIHDLGFEGYFETSAKEGWGISELADAIRRTIDWEGLPKVSSTQLFQQIKSFLISEKENSRLLSTVEDLYRSFLMSLTTVEKVADLRTQFDICIGRVESTGMIRRLKFGNLVLLQPELLDAYASAMVNAAKDEPDGLGCIEEEVVRTGRFNMPSDERISDRSLEELLLISTIEDLLFHEIALRELVDHAAYLIFPSQLTRERPDLPDPEGKAVIFSFEGPVLNIYATLIVRISHSGAFSRRELWKNAAMYSARAGGMCGVFLRELGEGRGEVALFFEENASEETRFQFEEYIYAHLQRRSVLGSITRRRIFICDRCGESITERQATRRRELGYTTINCPVCDTTILLLDRHERLSAASISTISIMDRAADSKRELETDETVLQGKVAVGDLDVHKWELLVIKRRRLNELEKLRAYYGFSTPPEITMEIEDLQREIEKLRLVLGMDEMTS